MNADSLSSWFGFALDGIIILLLGLVIFYAVRLSHQIRVFIQNRATLGQMLEALSHALTRADQTIAQLRNVAQTQGKDLEHSIYQAQSLSEELKLIIEAGDHLATRLESQATRNPTINPAMSSAPQYKARQDSGHKSQNAHDSFIIHDPEFIKERTQNHTPLNKGKESLARKTNPIIKEKTAEKTPEQESQNLQGLSQAERDLYEALQKKGMAKGHV